MEHSSAAALVWERLAMRCTAPARRVLSFAPPTLRMSSETPSSATSTPQRRSRPPRRGRPPRSNPPSPPSSHRHRPPPPPPLPPPTSSSSSSASPHVNAAVGASPDRNLALVGGGTLHSPPRTPSDRARFSARGKALLARSASFPRSWEQTLDQVARATFLAMRDGNPRLLVEVDHPHLFNPRHAVDNALLVDLVNAVCRHIVRKLRLRTLLVFESADAAALARERLDGDLEPRPRLGVLGHCVYQDTDDLCVLVSPCNRRSADPCSIEDVELLHYSSWHQHNRRLVIINPRLTACSQLIGPAGRKPTFLHDYAMAYFMSDRVHSSPLHMGGLMRQYPSNWQASIRWEQSHSPYKIAEFEEKPSKERVVAEILAEIRASHRNRDYDSMDVDMCDQTALDVLFT